MPTTAVASNPLRQDSPHRSRIALTVIHPMNKHRFAPTLAALALMALSACAHGTSRHTAAVGPPSGVFKVDNRTLDDLTVYLVRENGMPIRIGRVESMSRRDLVLSAAMVEGATLQLLAVRGHPRADRELMLMNPMRLSTAVVSGGRNAYASFPFSASSDRPVRWVISEGVAMSGIS
jgi:hypothetical protein